MGLPGLPEPGFSSKQGGLEGLPPPGFSEQPTDDLENLWTGAKRAPGAAVEMVKDIPWGVKNLMDLPGNLVNAAGQGASMLESKVLGEDVSPTGKTANDYLALADGDRQKALELMNQDKANVDSTNSQLMRTFQGIKGLGLAGAGAIGGPIGMTALPYIEDKFEQGVGLKPLTSLEDDRKNLGEGLGTNTVLSVFGKGLQKTIGGLAKSDEIANAMDRKSLGTRASDYGKASDTRTVETPEGEVESFNKGILDDLVENNKLGKSRNPSSMLKIADAKSDALNSTVDSIVKDYDANGGAPVHPTWDRALNYIMKNVEDAKKDAYLEKLKNIQDATTREGKGSLEHLQEQKKAYGRSYDPAADSTEAGFTKALYHDLKESIESVAPEVKDLNKELQKYIVVDPILKRSLRNAENTSPLSKLRDVAYTTGGIGAPSLIGAHLGGPVGAAVGASVGLGTKLLAGPSGQAAIARVLRPAHSIFSPIDAVTSKVLPPAVQAAQGLENNRRLSTESVPSGILNPNSVFSPQKSIFQSPPDDSVLKRHMKMSDDLQAALDEAHPDNRPYIKGLVQIESDGNPKAVGAQTKDGTAKGLLQFLDKTASDYGLKDPFDPKASVKAGDKMFTENLKTLGDPELAMLAHQRGAAGVKEDIKAAGSTDLDDLAAYNRKKWLASGKKNKRALETAQYISKIQKVLSA